jgi:heme/copper-type cytochrome/quinol oxidase subunit 3
MQTSLLKQVLGLVFVGFEIYEFAHYASEGVNPTIGSYWSSFFILLGSNPRRWIWINKQMAQTIPSDT